MNFEEIKHICFFSALSRDSKRREDWQLTAFFLSEVVSHLSSFLISDIVKCKVEASSYEWTEH